MPVPSSEIRDPTERVVASYVAARGSETAPIYMSHALRAIRTAMPVCDLSDRDLSNLVAAAAIRKGYNIAFEASHP